MNGTNVVPCADMTGARFTQVGGQWRAVCPVDRSALRPEPPARFRYRGERGVTYAFRDKNCIGRACWGPGTYQHRGATLSGSRATGSSSAECMNRAYHGCPSEGDPRAAYDANLAAERRREGWRKA